MAKLCKFGQCNYDCTNLSISCTEFVNYSILYKMPKNDLKTKAFLLCGQ